VLAWKTAAIRAYLVCALSVGVCSLLEPSSKAAGGGAEAGSVSICQ